MSEEFQDEFEGHGHAEFDWDAVERALGEKNDEAKTTDEPAQVDTSVDYKHIRKAVTALLRWAVSPTLQKRSRGKKSATISRRVVAMAWVICPELFSEDGKSARSLTEVSNSMQVHKAVMSEITAEFSKQFKFRNKFQIGHGWNFNNNTNENHHQGKK